MEQTAKQRKKRVGAVCPNPLFLQWLEEWRAEAKENGWNSHYVYHKAIAALAMYAVTALHTAIYHSLPPFHLQAVKSLKQYPLPLRSGQEAKILDGVGDKIANMLDKKLAKHSTDTGAQRTQSPPGALCTVTECPGVVYGLYTKVNAWHSCMYVCTYVR